VAGAGFLGDLVVDATRTFPLRLPIIVGIRFLAPHTFLIATTFALPFLRRRFEERRDLDRSSPSARPTDRDFR